ncbi:MAG: Co2+/Mg2+ efflux protein ApaG [Bdellovibrionales bacterium]
MDLSSEKTTHNFRVRAVSQYIPEQSDPHGKRYFFGYNIQITNLGTKPAQLLARHWIITDGQGRTQEVKGEGVVGDQPLIPPGGSYQYSSFCPLETTTGTMEGTYQMVDPETRKIFNIDIPRFFLVEPGSYN